MPLKPPSRRDALPSEEAIARFTEGPAAPRPASQPAPGPVPAPPAPPAPPVPSPAPPAATPALPWLAAGVERANLRPVNARIPERVALKLDYVAALTRQKRQDLIAEALEARLNAELARLGVDPGV